MAFYEAQTRNTLIKKNELIIFTYVYKKVKRSFFLSVNSNQGPYYKKTNVTYIYLKKKLVPVVVVITRPGGARAVLQSLLSLIILSTD